MLYLHSNTRNKPRRLLLTIGGVIAACITVLYLPVPGPVRAVTLFVAQPLWHARDAVLASLHSADLSLSERAVLVRRADDLARQVRTMEREATLAQLYAKDNAELRTLTYVLQQHPERIAAPVLESLVFASRDVFVIGMGSEQGVREYLLVRSMYGYPLGTVSHTQPGTAYVRLFAASGMRTEGILEGSSTVRVLLYGEGAGTLRAEVPRDISVTVGDPVHLPGSTHDLVGTVVRVIADEEDAFQTMYVRPVESVSHASTVFVDPTVFLQPADEQSLLQKMQLEMQASSTATSTAP